MVECQLCRCIFVVVLVAPRRRFAVKKVVLSDHDLFLADVSSCAQLAQADPFANCALMLKTPELLGVRPSADAFGKPQPLDSTRRVWSGRRPLTST
jgi:hypothetical protein